jgi:hypothetical protein
MTDKSLIYTVYMRCDHEKTDSEILMDLHIFRPLCTKERFLEGVSAWMDGYAHH